jgi:hypothetical protein
VTKSVTTPIALPLNLKTLSSPRGIGDCEGEPYPDERKHMLAVMRDVTISRSLTAPGVKKVTPAASSQAKSSRMIVMGLP